LTVARSASRYNASFFGLNCRLVETNIRDNFFGKDTLKSRAMEAMIGLLT
jgi:hypothetical protein